MDVVQGKRSRGTLRGTPHHSNSFCVWRWDAVPTKCPKGWMEFSNRIMLLQRSSGRINVQGKAARWLLNTAVVKEDARNEFVPHSQNILRDQCKKRFNGRGYDL